MLWGLGVGYVIAGMFFGWNLGLPIGGTLGMAIATIFVIIMYVTFVFSYTEMACAIPKAGGAFDYADRGLGKELGFLAGMCQNIEFVFAPPAVASAIGASVSMLYPQLETDYGISTMMVAVIAFVIFTALNISGVEAAASVEMVVTMIAIVVLLVFAGYTLPEFKMENLTNNMLPNGWAGAVACLPFAIWFFLAIEGVANVAEETIDPGKNILKGFGGALITLVALCILTFFASIGVVGWEGAVYEPGWEAVIAAGGEPTQSDAPIPLVLQQVMDPSSTLFKVIIGFSMFGLIASFNGIILAAGRSVFEFGRVGHIPKIFGKVNAKFRTPANALIINMLIGFVALSTGKTGEILTISCFGALGLYIISMFSFFALRKNEPNLDRPFKVPFYPIFPAVALVISSICMVALIIYNMNLFLIFMGVMAVTFIPFLIMNKKNG
ncbi:MAG: amino acid permease [Flavobacteriales bacterium]|nr:amino acid permease [Flavobacteriales bacterium]